ncbi:hypothetical protein ACU4GD_17845 [Cupriavidus basilensis]
MTQQYAVSRLAQQAGQSKRLHFNEQESKCRKRRTRTESQLHRRFPGDGDRPWRGGRHRQGRWMRLAPSSLGMARRAGMAGVEYSGDPMPEDDRR